MTTRRIEDILPILCCPISGSEIHHSKDPEQYWSSPEGQPPFVFPVIASQPVLMDFARSIAERESLLASQATSLVVGRPMQRSLAKRIVFGSNPVEEANAARLLELLEDSGSDRPVVLIVGGGTLTPGVQRLHDAGKLQIVCFDIYASDQTDFVADAHAIPLRRATVDAVWIQAVLEHVLDPHCVVAEIERVLRPNGLVYAETPFLQPVHEKAYDFTRFTENGHRWLFRGFELIDSGPVAGAGTTLFHILRYFAGAVLRNRKLGSLAALSFFWLRFFDRLVPRTHSSDMASGVYFLGRRQRDPVPPSQMPFFFKGVG